MSAPFEGLLVIELASVLAGPSVGQFFAEGGAEVIKVENPATGGDVTRRWKLPGEDPEADHSAYFAAINWGKRSVALDLTRPEGQRLLHDLVQSADVVVTSHKPGDGRKLGADAATLRALNPRLIVAGIVGYAEDDPRPGYDAVIQAESGFTFMNGESGGPPVKLPVALMDVLAAHQLKEGLLLALLQRERTGEGAEVIVSLFQSAVTALANQASNFLTAGHIPQRTGSDHPNIAPYGTVFETSDGQAVVLAVGTDRQFGALCEVLGLEVLLHAPTFNTNQKRVRNRPFLHALIQEQVSRLPRADLLKALAERGVPAGAVNDLRAVFRQPAAEALVLHDEASGMSAVRTTAFRLDDQETQPLTPPPSYAAHTRAVLAERLGLSDEDLDRLAEAGAIA